MIICTFSRKMITLWRPFLLATTAWVCCAVAFAQKDLPEQDVRFIERMRTELNLDSAQLKAVRMHFEKADSTIRQAELRVKELQTSTLPEEQISVQVGEWNAKKKTARETRDLDVQLLLTPEQKVVYDTRLKPAKPQVLHFGMHNRADCNVCKSP
jgi:hypothetical protein